MQYHSIFQTCLSVAVLLSSLTFAVPGSANGVGVPSIDLGVANYYSQTNYWFANNGVSPFGSALKLPTVGSERNSVGLTLGDADGDGDLDVFVANDSKAPNLLLVNDSYGNFTAEILPGGDLYTREIALGDIDNDGDLDALICNAGQNPQFLRNTGGEVGGTEGVFRLDQTLPSLAGIDNNCYAVALADLDNDGDLDAVFGTGLFGSAGQLSTRIAINQGGSTPFSLDPQAFAGGSTRDVAIADVDLDGDLDILVANDRYQYSYLLLNTGPDGTGNVDFVASPLIVADFTRAFGVTLGDVDSDGDMDALIANRSESPGGSDVLILNNGLDGTGNWLGFAAGIALNTQNSDSRNFALGDIDGDGDLDAVLSNQGSFATNQYYENLGGAGSAWLGFAGPQAIGTPMTSEDIVLGDLNGDGTLPPAGPDGLPILAANMKLLPQLILDGDHDGIPDASDACPDSDLGSTVVIAGCNSGVDNTLASNGCTINDRVAACAAVATNHGRFVSCVAKVTNVLVLDGTITDTEKGLVQSCAGRAALP